MEEEEGGVHAWPSAEIVSTCEEWRMRALTKSGSRLAGGVGDGNGDGMGDVMGGGWVVGWVVGWVMGWAVGG